MTPEFGDPSAVQVGSRDRPPRHSTRWVGVMRWQAMWRGFLGSFFSGACRLECG